MQILETFTFTLSCTVSHLLFLGRPRNRLQVCRRKSTSNHCVGWQNRQTHRTFCPSCTPKMTTETDICAESPRPKELLVTVTKKVPNSRVHVANVEIPRLT